MRPFGLTNINFNCSLSGLHGEDFTSHIYFSISLAYKVNEFASWHNIVSGATIVIEKVFQIPQDL